MITEFNNSEQVLGGIMDANKYQIYLGGELNHRLRGLLAYRAKLTGSERVVSSTFREAVELLLQKYGY